jgi:hypothetical protein
MVQFRWCHWTLGELWWHAERSKSAHRENIMPIHPAFGPVVALIAGILILMMPRLLNYIVAIYLIIIGILGLLPRSM